jgi:hypothetical protein
MLRAPLSPGVTIVELADAATPDIAKNAPAVSNANNR